MIKITKRKIGKKKLKKIPFEKWMGYLGNGKTDEFMKEIR